MIQKLTRINLYLAVLLIALVPFHAIISISANSLLGHYVLTRLYEEYILLIMLVIGIILFFKDFNFQRELFKDKLILLISGYLIILIIWAFLGHINNTVNLKATFYGLLLDSRFLIFFLLFYQSLRISKRLKININIDIYKLIMIPAFLVVSFGLLQIFILPYDFLSHLGYNKYTIVPFETVNGSFNYIRIISTLRGPNPLGAYMIFPISFLFVSILNNKKKYKNYFYLIASLLVLYFSYCRSAILGLALTLTAIVYLGIKNQRIKIIFRYLSIGIVILFAIALLLFRDNTYFQNIVFHTQKNSKYKTNSNQGHSNAIFSGIENIMHHPFGSGVGSAGQASVYNNHPAVISENYFLQIGEETGLTGLMIFVAIMVLILFRLYDNKSDQYSVLMFGITLGMIAVSMLWFTLSDETICFILFGLLAYAFSREKRSE